MSVWLLVSGDFTTHGGMDTANYALAHHLATAADARRGTAPPEVHIVSHRVMPPLATLPAVRVHEVARPFGLQRFGEPLLRRTATRWKTRLADRQVSVVANGGNLDAGDVNWVHYVHSAYTPDAAGFLNRTRIRANHRRYLAEERAALRRARVIVCNSQRTVEDVIGIGEISRDRTHVVYYGVDAERFGPVGDVERRRSRELLGLPHDRRVALFVGALGDRRKGFDTIYDAWRTLCASPSWDVDLVVVGTGAELSLWRSRAAQELPEGRMRFLGFRTDMPTVFAACDVLIHPARYEAYGLAVHEALCRGLPAIVSASAGVAERYPANLSGLLLENPASATELAERLVAWRTDPGIAGRVSDFASRLRARSWDHMARDIVSLARGAA